MRYLIVGVAFALSLTACTSSSPPEPSAQAPATGRTIVLGRPGPAAQRLPGGALIERPDLRAQMLPVPSDVDYEGGQLTVPVNSSDPGSQQLLTVQAGDHVISAPTAQSPDGFVVEVTGTQTSGNSRIISTVPASLEESVSDMTLDEDFDMPLQSLQSVTFADGRTYTLTAQDLQPEGQSAQNLGSQSSFSIPGINKDFSQVISNCGTGKIDLTGTLGSNLKGFLNVKIGFFTLKKVEAGVKLTQKANVKMNVACKTAFSTEFPLATLTYGTYVIWAGPIPVVVRPKVELFAGASGQVSAQVSFQVEGNSGGTLGLGWYKGSGFNSINTTNSTFTQTLSVNGSGKLRGWIGAKAGFSFYGGLADVYGYPKAFVEGNISASSSAFNYCLDAGLSMTAGGRLKVFGKTLARQDLNLGEIRQNLICGSTGGGTPPATPAPPTYPPDPVPCRTRGCQIP